MRRPLATGLAVMLAAGCGGATGRAESTTTTASATRPADLVGVVEGASLVGFSPAWSTAYDEARPAEGSARALAHVAPGAELDVFLGTWCGDSRREVSRFLAALELARAEAPEGLPFTVRFIAVDRQKHAEGLTDGADVRYVPTFVVRREGRELGRVVETAPEGIETDVLHLLDGSRTGFVSLTRQP